MSKLLVKYIDKISDFKNKVEDRNNLMNKKTEFKVKSEYSWLGEMLVITSNTGDKLSIDGETGDINYMYSHRDEDIQKKIINLDVVEIFESSYKVELIYDVNKGKYKLSRLKDIEFDSIDDFIKYLENVNDINDVLRDDFNFGKSDVVRTSGDNYKFKLNIKKG